MADDPKTDRPTGLAQTDDPQTGPGGAPAGNRNRVTHGLRAARLPKGCRYLEGEVKAFRRFVRNLLIERDGSVSLYSEALIQSACRHETRAALASRWLRKEGESLPLSERLSLTATISAATDARDKCLRALKLDDATLNDPWKQLESLPRPAATEEGEP